MKAKLTRTSKATSRTDPKIVHVSACGRYRLIKAGAVIDHPDAYRLCMMGYARPDDQECLDKLDYEGWGPDVFEDKFLIASTQLVKWERGIQAANTATPAPLDEAGATPLDLSEPDDHEYVDTKYEKAIAADEAARKPKPLTTEDPPDVPRDIDSGSILFDSETPED